MRKWLVVLILLWPLSLFAGLDEDFHQASSLYDQGEFTKSAALLQSMVDKGYSSADLYYNLGCAYFKAGQLGYAIANFHRAEKLAPDDEDVKINLEFAKLFVVDKIDTGPPKFFPDKVQNALGKIHPNQYFWISLVAFALVFLFLSLKRLRLMRRTANTLAVALLVLSLASAGAMVWVLKVNYLVKEGVIVASQTEVLSGPGSDFELQFDAHEGLTFKVLDRKNDYYLGLFANKLKGWVKSSAVTEI